MELLLPLVRNVLDWLFGLFDASSPEWVAQLLTALVVPVIIVGIMALFVIFFIWLERKVSAHMQDRLGPMRTGGWHGWAQSFADAIKLLFKEDIIAGQVDRALFKMAPYLVFAATAASLLVLPFGENLWGYDLNIGILYVMALGSIAVPGILMAAWGSNNKWSLFGGMRAAAQIVSYEVPAALSVVVVVMVTGSLQLSQIVSAQSGGIHNWLAFDWRFLFLGLPLSLVFFLSSLAEVNRTPFDLPEAESELVAGFHTEYSGMRFAFFFLAEYINMYIVSVLVVVLFFGGWEGAFPVIPALWTAVIGIVLLGGMMVWYLVADLVLKMDQKSPAWALPGHLLGWSAFLIPVLLGTGPITMVWKAFFVIFLQMWLRWTLPRLRVDQLMEMCWKYLVPAGLALFFLVGVLTMYAPWNAGGPRRPADESRDQPVVVSLNP